MDKYEVFLAEQAQADSEDERHLSLQVAKVPQLILDLNRCETSEARPCGRPCGTLWKVLQEQKELLDALPVREFHTIKVHWNILKY